MSTSIEHPWVLVRFGNAPSGSQRPGTSVAYLTAEADGCYFGNLMVLERNSVFGGCEWRQRYKHPHRIAKPDVLHVFPCPPGIGAIREARRALPKTLQQRDVP